MHVAARETVDCKCPGTEDRARGCRATGLAGIRWALGEQKTATTRIALTGAENVPGELIELLKECELTDEEMLADPKLRLDPLRLAGLS